MIEKEFRQFFRDPMLPRIVIVFPLLMMLVFPFAANMEVKNINLVVVDNDRTDISAELIEKCTGSGYFRLKAVCSDPREAQEMMDRGLMKRGSDEYIQKKRYITRAVGSEAEVKADYFEVDLMHGDYILLCSDGLTNMVDDDRLLSVISGNGSLEYKVRTLISEANKNGGVDNIAVILIRYTEGGEYDD